MGFFMKYVKVLVIVLVSLMGNNASAARDMNDVLLVKASGGGLVECWNALMDIKSCSNEIVLFFLNGQTVIGPQCCTSIHIITNNCWPAMLTSLGFTPEEGSILRGYCDADASSSSSSSSSASSPAPAPAASPINHL